MKQFFYVFLGQNIGKSTSEVYSNVSNKRTVLNNRTGQGDKLLKKNKRTGGKSSSIRVQV